MNTLKSVVFAALVLFGSAVAARDPADRVAAQSAAQTWLSLLDSENYSASWDSSANGVRQAISKTDWTKMTRSMRTPLGGLKSRRLNAALPKDDGTAVSFEFESEFEKIPAVKEAVTATIDNDGVWRVSGYSAKNKY